MTTMTTLSSTDAEDQVSTRLSNHLAYDSYGKHVAYQEAQKADIQNQYSDTFLRKTMKFWVLPQNFIAVKQRILRHIPEWRYDGKISPSLAESGNFCESIYWDTDELALYNKRILQKDGSMLFRYRWYGNGKCKMGFMEQKIRRESWRGEASIKQRFQLDPKRVCSFLKHGDKEVPLKLPFIKSMYQDIKSWKLPFKQTICTEYRRTSYQENNGAEVRMSFDEDVTLKDISGLTWNEALDPKAYTLILPTNKMFKFPLGILEVKLAFETFEEIDSLELPKWVEAMINGNFIIQIDKFSKYCTGVAVMNISKIYRVPSWVKSVKKLMEIEFAEKGQEWLGVNRDKKEWKQLKDNLTYPRRTEPREFLANERTFIKWVRMCFLTLFVGFGLLGFSLEPVSGIVFIIISMIVLLRAYYMYRLRMKCIKYKEVGNAYPFYDPFGPHLLMALFVIPTLIYLVRVLGYGHS
eukprot:457653_1